MFCRERSPQKDPAQRIHFQSSRTSLKQRRRANARNQIVTLAFPSAVKDLGIILWFSELTQLFRGGGILKARLKFRMQTNDSPGYVARSIIQRKLASNPLRCEGIIPLGVPVVPRYTSEVTHPPHSNGKFEKISEISSRKQFFRSFHPSNHAARNIFLQHFFKERFAFCRWWSLIPLSITKH